jgi:hydrogenase expression/formation protein HypC
MCLATPARVVELLPEQRARVDLDGVELLIRTDLTPEAAPGQYVIVHAGFALAVMNEAEAEETLRLLEKIYAPGKLPEP